MMQPEQQAPPRHVPEVPAGWHRAEMQAMQQQQQCRQQSAVPGCIKPPYADSAAANAEAATTTAA